MQSLHKIKWNIISYFMVSSFRSAPAFQLSEPKAGGVQRMEEADLMCYTKSCVELIKIPIWSITAEWKFSLVLSWLDIGTKDIWTREENTVLNPHLRNIWVALKYWEKDYHSVMNKRNIIKCSQALLFTQTGRKKMAYFCIMLVHKKRKTRLLL